MLYEITEEMKTTDPDKTTFTSKEKAAFVSTSHPDVDVVRLERLADVKMAVCDGDTDAEVKAKIKKQRTQILLTNPDSLHHAMLPAHKSWGKLLGIAQIRRSRRGAHAHGRQRRACRKRLATLAQSVRVLEFAGASRVYLYVGDNFKPNRTRQTTHDSNAGVRA